MTLAITSPFRVKLKAAMRPGHSKLKKIFTFILVLILFNVLYWGLRIWGHGLWVVYFALAGVVWWTYPAAAVRIRIAILLALQLSFEWLPRWLPPNLGGGDGGYTASLFLYWPLNLRAPFMAADHDWATSAAAYTVWAFIGSLIVLPIITYFRGKRFYCTMLCRWALISETLGQPFRSRAPKGDWPRRMEWISVGLLVLVVVLTIARALGLDAVVGTRTMTQWYQLVFVNYLTFIIGIAVIPLWGARAKCRYNCPMGVYLGFFQKLGRFRLAADAEKCVRCTKCDNVCDMGIPVMQFAVKGGHLNSSQCTGCGLCVSVCPTQALGFHYGGERRCST